VLFHRFDPKKAEVTREAHERMGIMIVYEDYLTSLVAERTFDHITARLGSDCEIQVAVRSFDVLTIPPLMEQAACEAKASDLVLLSIYGHGKWPAAVESWMEMVVGKGVAQHGGLAALLVREQRDASAANGERRAALEQLAQLSGRDFFVAKDVNWDACISTNPSDPLL